MKLLYRPCCTLKAKAKKLYPEAKKVSDLYLDRLMGLIFAPKDGLSFEIHCIDPSFLRQKQLLEAFRCQRE